MRPNLGGLCVPQFRMTRHESCDGIMGVDVGSRSDGREIANVKVPLSGIQYGEGANGTVPTNSYVTVDHGIVVDAGAFAETEFLGQSPPIVQNGSSRNMPSMLLQHSVTEPAQVRGELCRFEFTCFDQLI